MIPRGRKSASDHLTPAERDIWESVAETIEPLKSRRRKARVQHSETTDSPVAPERIPAPVASSSSSSLTDKATQKPRWRPLETTPTPKPAPSPPQTANFDRRHARKLANGRIEIDARIDLHGLRENEAHMRLRGFLRQAHADGKRTVLVITGKGRVDDDPTTPFSLGDDRRSRGVLKRNVPRWLAEPDLAAIVVSFTTASVRHGGEGALYVHLRRIR